MKTRFPRWSPPLCAALLLVLASVAAAQFDSGRFSGLDEPAGEDQGSAPLDPQDLINSFDQQLGLGGNEDRSQKVEFSSFVVPAAGGKPAQLVIHTDITPDWHVYSITQPKGGPLRTKITLDKSPSFRLLGDFKALQRPKIHSLEEIWPGVPIEEHYDQVTWVAPIEIAPDADPQRLQITGTVNLQVCKDNGVCIPVTHAFDAAAGTPEQIALVQPAAPKALGRFVPAEGNPVIRGQIQPQVVAPGDVAKLHITVTPEANWHVYPFAAEAKQGAGSKPTLIALTQTSGLVANPPLADSKILTSEGQQYHDGETTFTIDFPIPADAQAGTYNIDGEMGYQVCSGNNCLRPRGLHFRGTIEVGPKTIAGMSPLGFNETSYVAAANALSGAVAYVDAPAADGVIDYGKIQEEARNQRAQIPMVAWLGIALVAGFILNFMPCVLPVIGLKVMSFVQQAGEDRGRVFLLNAVYSLGIISVFWVLATLAVFANFSWGDQFQSVEFNAFLATVVFVFALSFLGVWEIPIPGFVGSGGASKMAEQEGLGGAFTKGILTTLLATPCTGPFLGSALGWSVEQPPLLAYLAFTFVGLGMAMPYLVIGAQPSLVRFLPRPGAWMETFKHAMGFVLMATVVFILTYIPIEYVVPTVATLMGCWAACWWIGRSQHTTNSAKKRTAWAMASVFAVAIAAMSFTWLADVMKGRLDSLVSQRIMEALDENKTDAGETPDAGTTAIASVAEQPKSENELPWEPFTRAAFERYIAEGKTVFVDFTADWCLVCKDNERRALNTQETRALVEDLNVVTLKADLTRSSPELKEMMRLLGHPSGALPFYAIFPADNPNQPIRFSGAQTHAYFLSQLEKAGPSANSRDGRTAMRPE